jgi:hypothetical protein
VTVPPTTEPGVPSEVPGKCLPPDIDATVTTNPDAGDPRAVITAPRPLGFTTWPAAPGISQDARTTLGDSFADYPVAVLVPPAARWPESTQVHVRVESFYPDPGFVSLDIALYDGTTGSIGEPVLSVGGTSGDDAGCQTNLDVADTPKILREMTGCASSIGGRSVVSWHEAGFRWRAGSGTLDVNQLVEELDAWDLLTDKDL